MCLLQKGRLEYEHRLSGKSRREPQHCSPRTVIIIGVIATLAGLFFVVAVVLMGSTPRVLLQPDEQTRTELNRTVPSRGRSLRRRVAIREIGRHTGFLHSTAPRAASRRRGACWASSPGADPNDPMRVS